MLIVGPEHAATIAQEYKTLESMRRYLINAAKLPFKAYAYGTCKVPKEMEKDLKPETLLPRFHQESIKMVVTGGPGKQSQFWVPFPQVTKPVSVKIAE